MEATRILAQIQEDYHHRLILTGLAALQYPAVLTRQLTFFNPTGGKEEYFIGSHHLFIRRAPKKKIDTVTHLLFIARHIDLYTQELDLLLPIVQEISLNDLERHDRAWRVFAYLKKHLLKETVPAKKTIGRRYIDLGDIESRYTVRDRELYIRDAILVPIFLRKKLWFPRIKNPPDRSSVEKTQESSRNYFSEKKVRPLFHRFIRFANRLESAASAKIEGYDASVQIQSLKSKMQKRLRSHPALRANLNLDNLHRDLVNLTREPLTLDFLQTIQQAIVKDTWRNESEKIEKSPGIYRQFDEVIVDRGEVGKENVVYIAPKHKDIQVLLEELIDFYYNSRTSLHPLDLAAIVKCQLVIIHPFGDGNGRLARWCFFYILVKEGFIESVHQAPISHIFLQEKNRYYQELANVDQCIMKDASYSIDSTNQRYQAHYSNIDIYRDLDYSSWIHYIYDCFTRALKFSMEEHEIFEKTQSIFNSFERKISDKLSPNQQHEVVRAIDIGIKNEWGKKTERRLLNNGLSLDQVNLLKRKILR